MFTINHTKIGHFFGCYLGRYFWHFFFVKSTIITAFLSFKPPCSFEASGKTFYSIFWLFFWLFFPSFLALNNLLGQFLDCFFGWFLCWTWSTHLKLNLQRCNSKVSVRPVHMWMVEENGNAKTEVERLEAEIEGLTAHTPDALVEVGVEVGYHGIFCCVDGKMSC